LDKSIVLSLFIGMRVPKLNETTTTMIFATNPLPTLPFLGIIVGFASVPGKIGEMCEQLPPFCTQQLEELSKVGAVFIPSYHPFSGRSPLTVQRLKTASTKEVCNDPTWQFGYNI